MLKKDNQNLLSERYNKVSRRNFGSQRYSGESFGANDIQLNANPIQSPQFASLPHQPPKTEAKQKSGSSPPIGGRLVADVIKILSQSKAKQ